MKSNINVFIVGAVFTIVVLIGWIVNIAQISNVEDVIFSGVMILKIVGIFIPPFGAVMGYIDL